MTISRSAQYSNINNIIITSDNSDWNQRDRDLPYAGQNSSETSDVSNTTDLIIMLSRDKN